MKKMKKMRTELEAGFIIERSRDCTFCVFSRWRVILAWRMTLVDEIGSRALGEKR